MRHKYLVATGATLVFLLAACGGGGSAEESANDGASPTTADGGTTAQGSDQGGDETTIRYLQATESLSFANLNYARSMGYFEDEGINLEVLPTLANASQVVQVMLAGEADLIATGSTGVLAAIASGRDVVSVGIPTKGATHGITMTNDWIESVAEPQGITADSSVEDKIRALEGATIATNGAGSTTDIMLRSTLSSVGLDPDADVTLRYVADLAATVSAAREGQADGLAVSLPDRIVPVAEGYGTIWIDFPRGDVPPLDTFALIDLATTREFAEANPEAIESFLRAVWRATDDFQNDPEAVREVLRENWFNEMDESLYDLAFDRIVPLYETGPVPTDEAFQGTLDLYNQTADEPVDLSFEDVYDPSFAEAAKP